MYHIKKMALSALFACIILATFSGTAALAATTTNLPASFLIGDQDGISVTYDGYYYINAVDLMPGDVITKKLTIQNLEHDSNPFMLYMTAEPLETNGPIDLLNAVHLTLKLDGREIYSGRIRGDEGFDMIQNALDLGTYATGDTSVMEITLKVDDNMQLSYEESEADIAWHFYAIRDEYYDPPKTGDEIAVWLCAAAAGTMLILSLVLILKKKRRLDIGSPANP